jgi:cytochrome c oxidase cbb3-type subunit III
MMRATAVLAALAALILLAGCKREERRFREPTPSSTASNAVTMSGLHPANPTQGTVPPDWPVNNAYEESAYAVSQGQKLFDQYNCSGCHAHGGGGIGPPLIDQTWVYGSQPQNVFQTIVEGRPNGMPSFRGKIPDQQVWELVSFVRAMSGQVRTDVAPGRSDHMYGPKPPENSKTLTPQGPEGTQQK